MNKAKTIKNAIAFVKERLKNEGTGHDWWHIERVLNNAKAISKGEKVDLFVVDLAVLLHDVGDRKVIHKEEDDFSIAEVFLNQNDVPVNIIEKIMFIIKNMSFSHSLNNKGNKMSKEFQ